ncbi:uncharacterized protein LOC134194947 [Corticium candelabrum]|uniref:uncharacterized protein LOC134194947 n=1 Tax=Corticium candelabrum TaxID=121492 RepID=UPI002E25ED64|nr:uncharacterized protein LOC134194947 [Corticium candelabrum]
MVSAWSDCLSQLQLHHVKEPKGRYVNSEDRSDIVVFDSALGVDLELDIAIAHPWSNEIEGLSATIQRAVATRRENLKIKKYDQELLPGGFRPTFVPIVLEHFGCWGEKAEDYLKKLSQLSRDEDGKPFASTFKTYWRSVFSVCLQRSNARVIDRKIKKIVSRDSHININSCK